MCRLFLIFYSRFEPALEDLGSTEPFSPTPDNMKPKTKKLKSWLLIVINQSDIYQLYPYVKKNQNDLSKF